MDAAQDAFKQIKAMNIRTLITQVLNLAMVVTSALMIWKFLMILTLCESPIVVVLSGSMEPAHYRGDLLMLYNTPDRRWEIGETVVFKIREREIPIVHRVIQYYENWRGLDADIDPKKYNGGSPLPVTTLKNGDMGKIDKENDWSIMTKGDNNRAPDRMLYARGQDWLSPSDMVGRAFAYAPYIGMMTIIMNDYPAVKFVIIGLLALFVIANREN